MVDPSVLLSSAGRLYGPDMDRLWGDVLPVPADRVEVLKVGEPDAPAEIELEVAGHAIQVAWTPGHASHHVSYFLPATRLAFVGDTAGLRRQGSAVALPASPPPDIDLEAWRASTDRILAWEPEQIFLTHFGAHHDPAAHLSDFWRRLEAWSRQVRTAVAQGPANRDPAAAAAFMRQVSVELTGEVGAAETEAYMAAGRFDFSFTGLERYWRKRSEAG
jgi:glyoxylase-like metal-dependent hydrolase (beta-lactamase superfamily II)